MGISDYTPIEDLIMHGPDAQHENNHNFIDAVQLGSLQSGKSTLPSSGTNEITNLDKVRDILFGNQMRDVEKRFTRLEERLLKECVNLREETRKRLDTIESYIKQEVDSLSERLKHEQGQRDESLQSIVEDNKKVTTALEKRLTQFDEQVNNSQRELREQILSQSKNLQTDILQKYEEILEVLKRESEELRHAKTDRSTLANLLSELAIRLNSQH